METLRSRILRSDTREGIPFAQVQIQGTSSGTQADQNGDFVLPVMPGSRLMISALGFTSLYPITNGSESSFSLNPDPVAIDQIDIRAEKEPREIKNQSLKDDPMFWILAAIFFSIFMAAAVKLFG